MRMRQGTRRGRGLDEDAGVHRRAQLFMSSPEDKQKENKAEILSEKTIRPSGIR
jgi:hypothetical protein